MLRYKLTKFISSNLENAVMKGSDLYKNKNKIRDHKSKKVFPIVLYIRDVETYLLLQKENRLYVTEKTVSKVGGRSIDCP